MNAFSARWTAVWWLFTGMMCPSPGGTDDRVPAPEIRFLAAGIRSARLALRSGWARFAYAETVPGEVAALLRSAEAASVAGEAYAGDRRLHRAGWWCYQDPQISVTVESGRAPERETMPFERLVADAREAKLLRQHLRPLPEGTDEWERSPFGLILSSDAVVHHGLWRDRLELDPRYHAFFYGEEPLDRVLGESDPAPVAAGEQAIEGDACLQVEWRPDEATLVRLWIDAPHGFVLRRAETYRKFGDRLLLTHDTRVPRLLESNGVWLPAAVETRLLWRLQASAPAPASGVVETEGSGRIEVEDGIATLPPLTREVVFSDFIAQVVLPPEVFLLEWPIETQVEDHLRNTLFWVAARSADEMEASEERN